MMPNPYIFDIQALTFTIIYTNVLDCLKSEQTLYQNWRSPRGGGSYGRGKIILRLLTGPSS